MINKKKSEFEEFLEDKKKLDKKMVDYNSIILDYRSKMKIASIMNFNLLSISKKIKILSQNFQNSKNQEIKIIFEELKNKLKNLKKNFEKFSTLTNEEILINNEFMAFVELPKKKIFCNIGILAKIEKIDKYTKKIEKKKFDKGIICYKKNENKNIQCNIGKLYFENKFENQKKIFEEKIEKFENHLKEYFEVEKELLLDSKASLISKNSNFEKKILKKKSTTYKLNLKKMIKNIKRNVQIENSNFENLEKKKNFEKKNFIFDKNNSLNKDCHFIDKSLIYLKKLKNSKIFNLNKKLKKMIFLLLNKLLVENDERDSIIIFWEIFQKNNMGLFTNFKKFGNFLKSLLNFKKYENKFGLCYFILNFQNFNFSENMKNFLKECFLCFNLEYINKRKKIIFIKRRNFDRFK